MTSSVIIVAADLFDGTAGGWIADRMHAAIEARGECTLALSGGSTPGPVLADLVGRAIPWPLVSVYFADERAVPPDDPASNFGMARRALLDYVPVRSDRVHRMEAEQSDLDGAARRYERLLPPALDILLLGVGPDGHTASLFPASPALSERGRRVVPVAAPRVNPRIARLTITPPVIEAAREVAVLVRGADKARIVARVLDGPVAASALPAQLALGRTWMLDQASAGELHERED